MLNPNQYQTHQAWVAFQLTERTIRTVSDGDFNLIGMIDAASGFMLGTTLVATTRVELSEDDARILLREGERQARQWPATLLIPNWRMGNPLMLEAERLGIAVIRVSHDELLPLIGEAIASFNERIGGDSR